MGAILLSNKPTDCARLLEKPPDRSHYRALYGVEFRYRFGKWLLLIVEV